MKQFFFDGLIMDKIMSFLPKTFTIGQKIIYKNYTVIIKKRTDKYICFILYDNDDIGTPGHISIFDIEKSYITYYTFRKKLHINNEGIEYFITNRKRHLRKINNNSFTITAQ